MSLPLVPSPVASSSTFLSGIYDLPRNGSSSTFIRSKKLWPCRDTWKPVHCGKGTSTRFSTTSISCAPHTREVSTEVILDDLDIVCTTYERSIYRGKIEGKVVLLCRQVDALASACSDPSVAQGLIGSIGKIVDLKSQGILNTFKSLANSTSHAC
jgi:hypothetical protein